MTMNDSHTYDYREPLHLTHYAHRHKMMSSSIVAYDRFPCCGAGWL